MATSVYFNNQGATREQYLIEDMVIESIKNHGIDVYYVPRDSQSELDELFGDDPVKSFTSAYKMEVYLETFDDFKGNQEFFSKFGLQVEKGVELALARRTFEKYIPYTTRNTPKEGDLIYLPVQQKLMEIKFVEQEKNFFQLGRSSSRGHGGVDTRIMPYMYGLSCETFKYNGEVLATGVPIIDEVGDQNAFSVEFTMQAGGTSTFKDGEIVYQGASLASSTAKAYVRSWDKPGLKLVLRNIRGAFTNAVVKGVSSGAQWTLVSGNVQEDATEPFDDNMRIETEGDNILDWSETNPFGSANE